MRTQKHKHNDIRKRRIDKTADEVKYFVLSCSFFNNFGSEGIVGHLSDLDKDVGTFLLERKPILCKRDCNYLSFEPTSLNSRPFLPVLSFFLSLCLCFCVLTCLFVCLCLCLCLCLCASENQPLTLV